MGEVLALVKSLSPAAKGIWLILAVALVTLIKAWPALRKMGIEETERLRVDRRSDYTALRAEFDVMKLRNGIVERHCTAVDVRLGQLEFILGMVLDELDDKSPGNPIAKKAREMFVRLYPVPPITEDLERLKAQLDPLTSPIKPRPEGLQ